MSNSAQASIDRLIIFRVRTLLWLGKSSVLAILRILEDINMAVRSRQQHQVSNYSMIAAIFVVLYDYV